MCFYVAGSFEGITSLDLSFSSLNHPQCIPTFCEYLKRDKALRLLNINCCKLPCGEDSGEYTAQLLRAIGCKIVVLNVATLVIECAKRIPFAGKTYRLILTSMI